MDPSRLVVWLDDAPNEPWDYRLILLSTAMAAAFYFLYRRLGSRSVSIILGFVLIGGCDENGSMSEFDLFQSVPASIDLGQMPEHTVREFDLELLCLKDDIKIESVIANCGCIQVLSATENRSFLAGERIPIRFSLSCGTQVGDRQKLIQIHGINDQGSFVTLVPVNYSVTAEVYLDGGVIYCRQFDREANTTGSGWVIFRRVGDLDSEPLELLNIESESEIINLREVDRVTNHLLNSVVVEDRVRFEIVIDNGKIESLIGKNMAVNTNYGIAIGKVEVNVLRTATATPSSLFWGILKSRDKINKTIQIENLGDTPVEIASFEFNGSGQLNLSVDSIKISSRQSAELRLQLVDAGDNGRNEGKVRIEFVDLLIEPIEIPISWVLDTSNPTPTR